MKIDGVEYKFKEGVRGNNDANRRFVGYIAQQIESVVPQAVQLIDGVLHVDYESLIPYLSESIKQNFKDLNNLQSKTDQIHQVVDMLYNEFMKKESKRSHTSSKQSSFDDVREYRPRRKPWKWIFGTSMALLLIISIVVGALFVWPAINPPTQPTSPITPAPATTTPSPPALNPIITPPPLTAGQLKDLAALEDFYDKMAGHRWSNSRNWLTNTSVCEWYGIECDKEGRVIEVAFTANGLAGSIPPSIADLDQLQTFAIELSALEGTLPTSITTLQHLEHLSLSSGIKGKVPPSLFSMPALQNILLEGNSFYPWEFPSDIEYSKTLTNIMLEDCMIVGSIPDALGSLPNLTVLGLAGNQIHGNLPSFASTVLEDINLGNNYLNGSVPRLPASVKSLTLKQNDFTGSIDIANLLSLEQLDISMNSFTGDLILPNEVLGTIRELDISINLFHSISLLAEPKNLAHCDMRLNEFACPISDWMKKRCGGDCL
jgi:hypothetical protein